MNVFLLPCIRPTCVLFFFFNDTATTEIYTLSLHDALPIFRARRRHSARNSRPAWSKARPRCSRKFGRAHLPAQRAPQLVLSFRSAVLSQGPRARRASPGQVLAPRRRRKRPPEEPQSQPQRGSV